MPPSLAPQKVDMNSHNRYAILFNEITSRFFALSFCVLSLLWWIASYYNIIVQIMAELPGVDVGKARTRKF